ncbi:MAG: MoaD/ThiS family protein [Planctomycetes bacterium]|nr:MoaD/ThiS family protein [Planctomycetota bacterium]
MICACASPSAALPPSERSSAKRFSNWSSTKRMTVERLRSLLAEAAPELLRVPVAFAVNQGYAEAGRRLADGDEVAFIPPISGGSGRPERTASN